MKISTASTGINSPLIEVGEGYKNEVKMQIPWYASTNGKPEKNGIVESPTSHIKELELCCISTSE